MEFQRLCLLVRSASEATSVDFTRKDRRNCCFCSLRRDCICWSFKTRLYARTRYLESRRLAKRVSIYIRGWEESKVDPKVQNSLRTRLRCEKSCPSIAGDSNTSRNLSNGSKPTVYTDRAVHGTSRIAKAAVESASLVQAKSPT
jgi:hypothetical protein